MMDPMVGPVDGAPMSSVALPPPGWYPDPSGDGIRWWSGAEWTHHAAQQSQSAHPASQPVREKRPWWRWILYAAAILLAGLLPMIIGVILWANPTYRRVGRITVYLSSATIVLIALAFVVGGLID
jgi:uncharacterized membrane protein YcjF (UPF0283 family)